MNNYFREFYKECLSKMDIIGSKLIMIVINDKIYCFLRTELEEYEKTGKKSSPLFDKLLKLLVKNRSVYIWYVDGENINTYYLDIKNSINSMVVKNSNQICGDIRSGRYSKLYNQYLVKSDDNQVEMTSEIDIYRNIINPSVLSGVIPNFELLTSIGKCSNTKGFFAIQRSDADLYNFIKEFYDKNPETEKIINRMISQSLIAYFYLLKKGYVHKDFKPQNVVVEKKKIMFDYRHILEEKVVIESDYLVKLIDFGVSEKLETVKNLKLNIIKDMNRFFGVLFNDKIYKTKLVSDILNDIENWKQENTNYLLFLKNIIFKLYD